MLGVHVRIAALISVPGRLAREVALGRLGGPCEILELGLYGGSWMLKVGTYSGEMRRQPHLS